MTIGDLKCNLKTFSIGWLPHEFSLTCKASGLDRLKPVLWACLVVGFILEFFRIVCVCVCVCVCVHAVATSNPLMHDIHMENCSEQS